jgi:hypothetical protein
MANLSERALLTRFSAPAWSGEKLDRLATQSNTVDKGAPSDAQKSISRLVPKHLLVKIRRVVQDARQVWYSLSLPWADKGERIMDSMAFEIMNKRMAELKLRHTAALEEIKKEYPNAIEKWRETVEKSGITFDTSLIPSVDYVVSRFTWSLKFRNVPDAGDFRVKLDGAQVDEIRKQMQKETDETFKDAQRHLWEQILQVARHFADVTSDPEKLRNCKSGTIENIAKLVEVGPMTNIARDPAVTEAIDQLRGLADYDLEALKDGVRLKKGKRDGDDTGRELANIHARAVVDDIDRKMAGVFGAPAPASTPSSNLQPAA